MKPESGKTAIAFSLQKNHTLNSFFKKWFVALGPGIITAALALVMIIGAIIAIVFGEIPLELIVFAQTVTIFLVPFIGIAMYAVANDLIYGNKHIGCRSKKIIA